MESERNNPWFKPWFNILLHTQSILCATVYSQCLEYLGYITLTSDTDDERKRQAQWEMATQNSLNDATGLKRHNGQKQSKLIQYIFD
jgi:hypothetical protein